MKNWKTLLVSLVLASVPLTSYGYDHSACEKYATDRNSAYPIKSGHTTITSVTCQKPTTETRGELIYKSTLDVAAPNWTPEQKFAMAKAESKKLRSSVCPGFSGEIQFADAVVNEMYDKNGKYLFNLVVERLQCD